MGRCCICGRQTGAVAKEDSAVLCIDCQRKQRHTAIAAKASEADDCSFFKDWTNKDRTTAFFEIFGSYVKKPNSKDFTTIKHIWNWAVHADKGLAEAIRYTMAWAGMSIAGETKRWAAEKK